MHSNAAKVAQNIVLRVIAATFLPQFSAIVTALMTGHFDFGHMCSILIVVVVWVPVFFQDLSLIHI